MKPKSRIFTFAAVGCLLVLFVREVSSLGEEKAWTFHAMPLVDEATTAHVTKAPEASVVTANGLHRASFETIYGKVIVSLPDDIRAGDTISGTVVVEPKGDTQDERKNNAAKLSDLKLNLGAKFPKEQKDLLIMITPMIDGRLQHRSA